MSIPRSGLSTPVSIRHGLDKSNAVCKSVTSSMGQYYICGLILTVRVLSLTVKNYVSLIFIKGTIFILFTPQDRLTLGVRFAP